MSIFYCPKCDTLEENFDSKLHKTVWANCRDGWGRPISHIICPECGYELAGHMSFENTKDNKWYVKDTISMYSDKSFVDVEKLIKMIKREI